MAESGVRCGNCGTLNEAGAQFCLSCGVLLAAYQSPSGSQPSAVEPPPTESASRDEAPASTVDEPGPPPASVTEDLFGTTKAPAREPGDAGAARSVDDIFSSLPDVDEIAKAGAATAPIEPATPDTPMARPIDETPPTRQDVDDAPAVRSPTESTETAHRPAAATGPVEIEQAPPVGQARSAPRPVSPPVATGRRPADRGWEAFGRPGTRTRSTPPQTLIVIGGGLILASCVLGPTATLFDFPFLLAGPMWCAFPLGVIVLVIGVIQLASRRPTRF